MAERTEMTPATSGGSSLTGGESSTPTNGADTTTTNGSTAESVGTDTATSGINTPTGGASGLPPRGRARAGTTAEDTRGKPDASAGEAHKPRPAPKAKAGKKSNRTWRDTGWGRTLELLAYLVMLVLAIVYFTGKGLFIYEGF
jgi:hypothetical protein